MNLKATLPAVCTDATYTPPVDTTKAESYYFWDIDGAPFNKSVYTPYVTNVLAGLRLTYYFEYSTECTQQLQNFMSQIYYSNKNLTCEPVDGTVTDFDKYKLLVYYAGRVVSTEVANSFQNCYLFGNSVYNVANKRIQTFADFTDFYTSFLFNLLS